MGLECSMDFFVSLPDMASSVNIPFRAFHFEFDSFNLLLRTGGWT